MFVPGLHFQDYEVVTRPNSDSSKQFKCHQCLRLYCNKSNLVRHLRRECGVNPQFECPICFKKSKHKHNLLLHMRIHQKP